MLDPWQAFVLEHSLGERPDGRWSAFEVGVLVSRQNGKGSILEARELAGLFLFGERLILHSAHEFKTSSEAFRRIRDLIEGSAMFRKRVKRITNNTAEVGIELTNGQRLKFVARSGGSGRGFTGDCIILDEAFNLPDAALDALMPTMSARPNPQLWYTSSAPDRDLAPCGPLSRIRERGVTGDDPSLFFAEWSIDAHTDRCGPACEAHDDPSSPESWAKANPGLGIRISVEHVARELASMGGTGFARERLGVGNYATDGAAWSVIGSEEWSALAVPESKVEPPVAIAVDMTPDRANVAVAVAGRRGDGLRHIEVIHHERNGSWVVDRLVELVEKHRPVALVVDVGGPAGSLLAPLEAAGVEVVKPTAREAAQACGQLFDAVAEQQIRHLDQAPLNSALAGARRRPLGDGWAWDRRDVSIDISPLVAVTLAAWGHEAYAHLNRPRDVAASIW